MIILITIFLGIQNLNMFGNPFPCLGCNFSWTKKVTSSSCSEKDSFVAERTFTEMQKAKKYNWKDSNLALFGSDTDKKVLFNSKISFEKYCLLKLLIVSRYVLNLNTDFI